MLINGEKRNGRTLVEVKNPYDGSVIDAISSGSPEDVHEAIGAAYSARKAMRALTAYERSEMLFCAYEALVARQEEFAAMVCQEVGKTIREARGELERAAEVLRLSSEETKRFGGEQLPLDGASNGAGKTGFTLREPCGVVAAIVPFNFPVVLSAHKLGPALAAGNTVVLKPPHQAPIASSMFAELLNDAGFPTGAVNCVPGGAEVGYALVRDNRVRVVAFGGSDRTGEIVAKAAGMKRLLLECGSSSSVAVMETADLERAVAGCLRGGYAVAGQMCIHVQKVLVHENVIERFMDMFVAGVNDLKVGDPRSETTDVGPLVDEQSAERLDTWIAEAVRAGAEIIVGGNRSGTLFSPTVLRHVNRDMRVFKDEVFGPVVSIITMCDIDEAIELTNATDYGLNTGIFTNRLDEALKFVREAEYGSAFVNEVSSWRADMMPYGGVKRSGLGREGIKYAMDAMSEHKVVSMQI